MNIKILEDSFDKKTYNNAALHPMQSWEWGEARKTMGIRVIRIGAIEGDTLKNVFQITLHHVPKTGFFIGYLPRSIMPDNELLSFLYEYGKKHKVICFTVEPYAPKQQHITEYQKLLLISYVNRTKHPLFPSWTQILDISRSEDELLKIMKPKTRYNTNLATKKGVVIREESNDKGFETFSQLYFETCKRQHYFGHTPRYHRIIWDNLKDTIAHILIASYQHIPIAAYELFFFKNTFYYPYGGSSLEHRNTMAANLLMWEAIKLGKKLGAKSFDMWGSLPPDYDQKNPWAGFTRFKEGYGTEFVEMVGSLDVVCNPTIYTLYNVAYSLRNIMLSVKKKLF